MKSHLTGNEGHRRSCIPYGIVGFLFMISTLSPGYLPGDTICPVVDASSVWASSTASDFNAPGSYFQNCSVRSTGDGAEVQLESGWGWKEIRTFQAPAGRSEFGIAPIANTTNVLIFGGSDMLNNMGDTWVFDLAAQCWTQQLPDNSPPPRRLFSLAGIATDDKAVLFGGLQENPFVLNDTWVYDFGDDEWYNRTTSVAPPARRDGAMSGIENTDKVMLFGGNDWSKNLDDTWVYDVGDNTWTQMSPGTKPPARCGHAMAPIAGNESVLLFGGLGPDWFVKKDTWTYELGKDQWHNKTPIVSPDGRWDHALATFFDTNEIIMFGGQSGTETWIYSVRDNCWTLNNTHNLPRPRIECGLGTVRGLHQVILWGGSYDGYTFTSEAWLLVPGIHKAEGLYMSRCLEVEKPADFIALSWNAFVPAGTKIEFQARTGNSSWNMSYEKFRGPDGSPNTTFKTNSTIASGNRDDRLVQYRVFFYSNKNQTLSPIIKEVRIDYSRFPDGPLPTSPLRDVWLNTSQPIFEWNFSDADDSVQDGYEWELFDSANRSLLIMSSGAVNTSYTGHVPDEPLQDGVWLWHVRTRDPAFNWGPFCDLQTVRIDTIAPIWGIVNVKPAGWTNGPCDVSFSASDNTSGVESLLAWVDGRSIGPQIGSITLDGLPDGIHSILLRAYDRAGNFAYASARAFTDGTEPEPFVPVLSPPSWSRTDPELAFETVDNTSGLDRFEISIGGMPFSVEKSPFTLSDLSEGATSITIRAYDRGGNFRDSSASVFIDRTPPVALFISATPAGWTNTTPEIGFGAIDNISDVDHYQVRLNNGTWSNRTSPFIPDDLPEGINNITVRAYDRAGNYGEGTVTAFYDRTPPAWFDANVEPANWTRVLPTLKFNAADNVSGLDHYEMSLDGAAYKKVSSPYKFLALSEGSHNITIRAFDRAGNAIESIVKTFVDMKAPFNLKLKVGKGLMSRESRNVTLDIKAEDATSGVEMMCFSNNGTEYSAWEPFGAKKVWAVDAGDGARIILVKVRDRAGNEALPVSVSIDTPNDEQEIPWMMLLAVAIIVCLVIGGMAVSLKRRKRK